MFSQKLFKSEDSHLFCRNISKRLTTLRREIVQNANRVNNGLLNFLFQYLVINNIEFAEIEIFFSFLTPLIDVSPPHTAADQEELPDRVLLLEALLRDHPAHELRRVHSEHLQVLRELPAVRELPPEVDRGQPVRTGQDPARQATQRLRGHHPHQRLQQGQGSQDPEPETHLQPRQGGAGERKADRQAGLRGHHPALLRHHRQGVLRARPEPGQDRGHQ